MTASLVVPEDMATSVCEFLATESIPLDVVTSGPSAVRVEASVQDGRAVHGRVDRL